jgi:hypothetical protein
MIEFFKILFFSKLVLLTPGFVDIDNSADYFALNLNEPISAINSGASVQIDVTRMIQFDDKPDVIEIQKRADALFSDEVIEVVLVETDKTHVLSLKNGGASVNANSAILSLSGQDIPTGVDFKELKITSSIKLEKIKIYWKNFKK